MFALRLSTVGRPNIDRRHDERQRHKRVGQRAADLQHISCMLLTSGRSVTGFLQFARFGISHGFAGEHARCQIIAEQVKGTSLKILMCTLLNNLDPQMLSMASSFEAIHLVN